MLCLLIDVYCLQYSKQCREKVAGHVLAGGRIEVRLARDEPQLLGAEVLVVDRSSHFLQVLHVRPAR